MDRYMNNQNGYMMTAMNNQNGYMMATVNNQNGYAMSAMNNQNVYGGYDMSVQSISNTYNMYCDAMVPDYIAESIDANEIVNIITGLIQDKKTPKMFDDIWMGEDIKRGIKYLKKSNANIYVNDIVAMTRDKFCDGAYPDQFCVFTRKAYIHFNINTGDSPVIIFYSQIEDMSAMYEEDGTAIGYFFFMKDGTVKFVEHMEVVSESKGADKDNYERGSYTICKKLNQQSGLWRILESITFRFNMYKTYDYYNDGARPDVNKLLHRYCKAFMGSIIYGNAPQNIMNRFNELARQQELGKFIAVYGTDVYTDICCISFKYFTPMVIYYSEIYDVNVERIDISNGVKADAAIAVYMKDGSRLLFGEDTIYIYKLYDFFIDLLERINKEESFNRFKYRQIFAQSYDITGFTLGLDAKSEETKVMNAAIGSGLKFIGKSIGAACLGAGLAGEFSDEGWDLIGMGIGVGLVTCLAEAILEGGETSRAEIAVSSMMETCRGKYMYMIDDFLRGVDLYGWYSKNAVNLAEIYELSEQEFIELTSRLAYKGKCAAEKYANDVIALRFTKSKGLAWIKRVPYNEDVLSEREYDAMLARYILQYLAEEQVYGRTHVIPNNNNEEGMMKKVLGFLKKNYS